MKKVWILAAIALSIAVAPALSHQFVPPAIVARIPPRDLPVQAVANASAALIEKGRAIFERQTFGGNGRTCATCHRRDENFTLSPADVARRAAGDALFVHEQRPELAELENAVALRERALILENLDGFDRPGVLRSVMHLFALRLSTDPQPGFPLTHTLGWSGDGSPGEGSLREFAVGAVVQHMPRSLERVEGRDFRLPTAQELDALEAFQLSLGRRADINADPAIPGHIVFRDANVTAGQILFHGMPSRQGTRRCGGCHTGGGALNDLGQNEQRATGVSFHANAPACLYPSAPGDGGFGADQVFVRSRSAFCAPGAVGEAEFRGNQFFSTQSIIEAADTGPFFHNNAAATLEEVVDHYRSGAFNNSVTGAGNGFVISDDQRNQIASFLRALNVLENIRAAEAAIDARGQKASDIVDARNAVADAVGVLRANAPIHIYQVDALPDLEAAQRNLASPSNIGVARVQLASARSAIVVPP